MKKLLLVIALQLLAFTALAQKELSKDYVYNSSTPYEARDGREIFFTKANEVLALKINYSNGEVYLQKFNSESAKADLVKETLYKDLPKKTIPINSIEFNNKYYYFYALSDGEGHDQIFVREIDFEKGTFTGDGKLLFKVSGRASGVVTGWWFKERLNFAVLTDLNKKMLLVQYLKIDKNNKLDDQVIGIKAFDADLKIISDKEIKLPYKKDRVEYMDYAIDGVGDSYMMLKVFEGSSDRDNKKDKDGKENSHIEIFKLKKGAAKFDITTVNAKDKFISGARFFEHPDKYLVCAGFYNLGNPKTNNGLIYGKVDANGAVTDLKTFEIPLEIVNQYIAEREVKKNTKDFATGDVGYPYLTLNDLAIDAKGGLLLIAEQDYTEVNQGASGLSSYPSNYNDILLVKADAAGKLLWMKKIPKHQRGIYGKGSMSFKQIEANGYNYFFFIDNVKNYNLPKDKVPAEYADREHGYFTAYKVNNATGDMVCSTIFNTKDVGGLSLEEFEAENILKLVNNEILFEMNKKKKDVIIKVKLN
ncbi:hypothetical protein [Flavobacterium subsaxonicum]|uniref:Uncharacterized protein n=1 Tax=Flavobacterium subsaxonicum WB 4.1-42 = DSM 21790 TaxID=1121898 RepID=A0A0A2MHU1_9FLAO|nr:hypothetical protein [Flavobacterium subsaxonicum]KGO92182.1 hypothetical protein Q766_13545 [Flavobacterium subsaxonicum WB 4.1-42 = DSM 21790]